MDLVGRQVKPEEFDRDELVLFRIVGTENRAKRASPYLMKNAKRTERFRMSGAGSFRVQ